MASTSMERSYNVLVCCTGSVASIKIPQLVQELRDVKTATLNVRVVATEKSLHFFDRSELGDTELFLDEQEWTSWKKIPDPVLHIELRRWADLMVIAPLDANTLAKVAAGICDNLLTCIIRAWDMKRPLLFCPAMNTFMWEHALTGRHIQSLKELGYREVPCVKKKLACGDTGFGGMAAVGTIVSAVTNALLPP
uniref:Phosphopantothenoylcysteine decarboxylase n=1 Tax=Ornithodoros turicata TaxID=34597 RepID=A0A2R5LMD7_9ACAR